MSNISNKKLSKLIQRRHPLYKSMLAHWAFLESTYEGGRGWFKSNIFKFYKEGGEYDNRVTRAYRFNHTREVVDLVNKYLFRGDVSRNTEDAPQSVKDFWLNTNGKGMDITEMMKVVSKKSSITGCPWIIIDNRNTDTSENKSKQDESSDDIYAYVISPEMVLDYSWGDDGELNWILVKEAVRDDEDPFESSGDVELQYRIWTRNEWYLIKKKSASSTAYDMISGLTNLGMVPAIRADNLISDDPYSSTALINDIAYLDRAVANYLSNLDEIIQDQTFSQLAMPAQGVLPGTKDADGNDLHEELLRIGTKRIFTFDGEGGGEPKFISPDPRQAELIISAIQQIISEIYHSVGMAGERTKQDNSKGIDNSSGVAKAKDFERVNSLLKAKADSLERIENRMIRIVAAWAGEENKISENLELVEYPETFDVRALFDEFDIASQLMLLGAPEEMRGEQLMNTVKKLFPGESKKNREKWKSVIDEWVKDLKKRAEIMTLDPNSPEGNKAEEPRNREMSGDRQSATKQREAKRVKEQDQANGQKETNK